MKNDINASQKVLLDKYLLLENIEENKGVNVALFSTCAFLIVLFIWLICLNINVVTSAQGELVPEEQVKIAQHLEGGIVDKVYKRNSELVHKGDVVLMISDQSNLIELEKMLAQKSVYEMDMKRLQAYISLGSNTVFDMKNWFVKESLSEVSEIQVGEESLLRAKYMAHLSRNIELLETISYEEHNMQHAENELPIAELQLATLKEEKEISENLYVDKLVSKNELLGVQREYYKSQGNIEKIKTHLDDSKHHFKEAQFMLNSENNNFYEEVMRDLLDIKTKMLQLSKNIKIYQDKVDRLTIVSPITGIVNKLEISSGAVIKPGQELLEIVPQSSNWELSARVDTKNIGNVRVSDPAIINVDAFDYTIHGSIKGVVQQISAGNVLDERTGESYYKVVVAVDKENIPTNMRLLSGMTANAEIISGQKKFWQFLLKPMKALFG